MKQLPSVGCLAFVVAFTWNIGRAEMSVSGPLRVGEENPRYFEDGNGRTVYLTGFHTWNTLSDIYPPSDSDRFDFEAYIKLLESYHCNFVRLWTWDLLNWNTKINDRTGQGRILTVAPHAWLRVGPASALDGGSKFDLTQFDPEYFSRLRSRVMRLGEAGIYVSVMLFEGWGAQFSPDAYRNHPFYPDNNINGLELDVSSNEAGLKLYELVYPEVTHLQEAYVRKVIETVGDLDNVLYEISNENHPASTAWQYHMINFVRAEEAKRGKVHPIGMTFQYKGGRNEDLYESPADWISPYLEGSDAFATMDIAEVTAKCRPSPTGYVVEASIPLDALGLAAGDTFGLDLRINDDDDGGLRERQISWTVDDASLWDSPEALAKVSLVPGLAGPGLTIEQATSAVVVDGEGGDPAWRAASAISITHALVGEPVDNANLSGRAKLLHDGRMLYVLCEVTDDRLCADSDGVNVNDDSVELFFDTQNDGGTKPGKRDFLLTFEWSPSGECAIFPDRRGPRTDPRDPKGEKVIIIDTDHLWGIGGSRQWVWKSFLQGMCPIFMDPYDGKVLGMRGGGPNWADHMRRTLGYTLAFAERLDMALTVPSGELASTGYCLAQRGERYLVYLPDGDSVDLNLTGAQGRFAVEWFNPNSGLSLEGPAVTGGSVVSLKSPLLTEDAVVFVSRRK